MKPLKNPEKPSASDEKELQLNARARYCIFEYISIDVFNQIYAHKANEILLKLQGHNDMVDGEAGGNRPRQQE